MENTSITWIIMKESIKYIIWIVVMLLVHAHMVKSNKEGKIYSNFSIIVFSWFFPAVGSSIANLVSLFYGGIALNFLQGWIEVDIILDIMDYASLMLSALLNGMFSLWAIAYHIYMNYRNQGLLWCGLAFLFVRVGIGLNSMQSAYEDVLLWGCAAIIVVAFLLHYIHLRKKIRQRAEHNTSI